MGSAIARSSGHDALAYAGEVSAQQAWEQLSRDTDAALIDVRTPPEWTFCGEPDLSSIGKQVLRISWKTFPSYALNDQFITQVSEAGVKKDAPVFLLCRTGGRSLDAAMALTREGYTQCYNITDGFEGQLDESRRRGTLAGWKALNLPWGQA